MLAGYSQQLDEQLVLILAKNPNLTVTQIHHALLKKKENFALSSVYQELRKLQSAGVVIRIKGLYALHMSWLIRLQSFLSESIDRNMRGDSLAALIPQAGSSFKWNFPCLSNVLYFWTQILLYLLKQGQPQAFFENVDHVWFQFAEDTAEKNFLDSLRIMKIPYYLTVQSDTSLDRSYQSLLKGIKGEIIFGRSPFVNQSKFAYCSLIGDFIINVILDAKITRSLNDLYSNSKNTVNLLATQILEVMNQRGKISLTLRHHPEEAKKIRKKFVNFLGNPLDQI